MELLIIKIKITSIVYENLDKSYYRIISGINLLTDENITVLGVIYGEIQKNQICELNVEPKEYSAKYCKYQYKILKVIKPPYFPAKKDPTRNSIVEYFESKYFVGIGPKKAQIIYDKFGNETLIKLIKNPSLIKSVKKLGEHNIKTIFEHFTNYKSENRITAFFLKNNINLKIKNSIENEHPNLDRNLLFQLIITNPYLLFLSKGLTFKKVDNISIHYNSKNIFNDKRIAYNSEHIIKQYCFTVGDTYADNKIFYAKLKEKFWDATKKHIELGIDYAKKNGLLYITKSLNKKIIVHPMYYNAARTIFIFLKNKTAVYVDKNIIKRILNYIENLEQKFNIKYNNHQKKAIINAITQKFSVIIGGPGTGKTTIIKAIVEFFKIEKPNYQILLLSPTGRAADNMIKKINHVAWTIHKYKFIQKRINNKFKGKSIIIIDETSMVDVFMFSYIIKDIENISRLIIVGDYNQLPSIAPSQILNDIVWSQKNKFAITNLDQIYRQKQGNKIIKLLNEIIKREFKFSVWFKNQTEGRDVLFYESTDVKDAINEILLTFEKWNEVSRDVQIIIPNKKNELGVININNIIQKKYNPNITKWSQQFSFVDYKICLGDRVMHIKNNYFLNVFNGEIGYVTQFINNKNTKNGVQKIMIVEFEGPSSKKIEYSFKDANELILAYACTVHKTQGSEFKNVIFVYMTDYFMANINLLYTAISRAKNKIKIITNPIYFEKAIGRDLEYRKTLLSLALDNKLTISEYNLKANSFNDW